MSLNNSIQYMELSLRRSFSNTMKRCRLERGLSQGDLANILMDPAAVTEEEYLREHACWKKKISNWENGYSLPNLETFFYLVTLFGKKLSDDLIKGNKLLEECQNEEKYLQE